MCKSGCLRQEHILHHQKLEILKKASGMILIGFRLQWILSDHIERAEISPFHGLKHLRQVPASFRRNLTIPFFLKRFTEYRILNVLKTRQAIRQRTHIASALDVVLSSERIKAAAILTDVSREQREIDQCEDVVDGVVMLGYSERPTDHRPLSSSVSMSHISYDCPRNTGFALGIFQRVGLDTAAVLIESGCCIFYELSVLETCLEDFTSDCIGKSDVGTHVETSPNIRPLNRTRASRIDRITPPAVPHAF